LKPGPTGNFPEGKLDDKDKGELVVAIVWSKDYELLLIEFGTSVTFLAMKPEQARNFAQLILKQVESKI